MELTSDNFNKFIERLKYHNRGDGVDDHCTANPLFVVQELKRHCGIDLAFDPPHYWADGDHELQLTDDELVIELAEWVANGGGYTEFDIDRDSEVLSLHDGCAVYTKIGYAESWEAVNIHFTREAAEAFINRKKHDHLELRIYVDSQYWCWEFNSIIDGLLSGKIGMIEAV